jgi:NADH-quinone oxidoreductase subunit C
VADSVRAVGPEHWVDEATAAFADPGSSFDWLSACDELGLADELRVVLRFDTADGRGLRLETRLPREDARLPTLRGVLPGVTWHERETSELYGIVFDGGDPRPLLIPAEGSPGHPGGHPLRKDYVLGARAVTPWPADQGGADDARRRQSPAGVPDPAAWGDRPADAGPPDPLEVLPTGGRRRR